MKNVQMTNGKSGFSIQHFSMSLWFQSKNTTCFLPPAAAAFFP
jgi:hypothetical protein